MRFVVAVCALALLGCGKGKGSGSGAASAAASGSGAPAANKPVVVIPAGQLKAGTPCTQTPRVSNEELLGDTIELKEFSIDVLPYPNDPTKPARTDVTRDEAEQLCKAEGKRLCTELEWERACKGPNNTMFEYGNGYSQQNCKVQGDLMPDKRPKCVSGFGVKDMHGLVFEWTASPWGRGSSGDLATVRGGQGGMVVLQARCASGQGRAPSNKGKDVGFRCCGGPANAGTIDLRPTKQPPMVQEPGVEANLGAAMLKAMPPDHRTVANTEVTFDRLWRWHPRDSEELLIGRWHGKPKEGKPFDELAVFKVCNNTPSLLARMRGPVEKVDNPGAGSDPQKVSVQVATGTDRGDVKLTYWYGQVQIEQPQFVKVGNALAAEEKDAGAPDGGSKVIRPRLKVSPKKK